MKLPTWISVIAKAVFNFKFVKHEQVTFHVAVMVEPRVSPNINWYSWPKLS